MPQTVSKNTKCWSSSAGQAGRQLGFGLAWDFFRLIVVGGTELGAGQSLASDVDSGNGGFDW